MLHDVFGLGSGKSRRPSTTTPLPAVSSPPAPAPISTRRDLELAEAFHAASRSGDMKALSAMLAAEVSVHADGGGKRPAAMKPIIGFDAVMKMQNTWRLSSRRMAQNFFALASLTDFPASSC